MSRVINILSVYKFFDDFIVVYPLYAVMFANSGLTVAEISVLFFAWSFTTFVLEIPSGVLADKFDRKTILVLSQLLRIVGYSVWLFFPTFWGYLVGFVLWGIKSAFTSGTFEAYLYDSLKSHGSESQFAKFFGRIKSLSFLAIFFSAICASFLPEGNFLVILGASLIALVISSLAALNLPRAAKIKSTGEVRYLQLLKQGLVLVARKKELFWAVAFLAIIVGFMAVDEYLSLYAVNVGLPVKLLGGYLAIYSLVQALSSLLSHKVKPVRGVSASLLLLAFGMIILLIGFLANTLGLIMWLLLAAVSAYIIVVSEQNLQDAADSNVRATVSSVKGFVAELLALSVYILFSMTTDDNVGQIVMVLGLIVITVSGVLSLWRLKSKF